MWQAYRNAVEEKLPRADITSASSVTMYMLGFILANTSMRPSIKCVARRTVLVQRELEFSGSCLTWIRSFIYLPHRIS